MNAPNSSPRRDAIVFLPGIGGNWSNASLERVARQLAQALDLADEETHARFDTEVRFEDIGGQPSRLCTISRRAGASAPPVPVLDVVELDYRLLLKSWFEQKPVLMKCLTVFSLICSSTARYVRGQWSRENRGKRVKTVGQQLQLAYASGILLLLSSYFFLLLLAAAAAGAALWQSAATPAAGLPAGSLAPFITGDVVQVLFVLATLLGVAAPSSWKKLIENAASNYVCLLHYLTFGTGRSAIVGQFREFMERFLEWGQGRYRHVHVFSYSFGTVVALDTLFPSGAGPSKRMLQVHTLVTIASPFDLTRLMWPAYFKGRTGTAGLPTRWLNLYSQNDVIGSSFRNDDRPEPATETVECASGPGPAPPRNILYKEGPHGQELSFLEFLLLRGLSLHGQYWQEGEGKEQNCFDYIVEQMPDLGRT